MLMKIMAIIGSLCIILFYMLAMFKAAGIRSRWEKEIEDEFEKNLYNKEKKHMIINIKKLRSDAVIPKRGSNGAAGYDLYSCNGDVIQPHETKKFETLKPKRVTTFLPLSASLRLNLFMLSIFLNCYI